MLEVYQIPALQDNYAFILHEPSLKKTATVDTPDAQVILDFLKQKNWELDYIFNTHHHFDHVGGNLMLKEKYNCQILGSQYDANRNYIPGLDIALDDGDVFHFGKLQIQILFVPGHTLGMINYYFPLENILFTGDCLFSLGCGRLFEGSPKMMWGSLKKLRELPDVTRVYCAHEYTEKNTQFALTLQPDNKNLLEHYEKIKSLRSQNKPTVPTIMNLEKELNPFLRADKDDFVGMETSLSALQKFTQIRGLRSKF